ncbi:MAG: hypothetical protein ACRD2L_15805 [Terriglobia bacterium]
MFAEKETESTSEVFNMEHQPATKERKHRPGSKLGRQLGVRWQEDRRKAFDALAAKFKRDSAEFARLILDEFLSCFLSSKQHEEMGTRELWGHHGLLELALREARKQMMPGE